MSTGRATGGRRAVAAALGVAVGVAGLAACGDREAPAGRVIRVPADEVTIQQGVDRARKGDLVLVAPGTYRESVRVTKPGITIRGEDRNTVVLDGEHTRENGIAVGADGVAVENLTVRHYNANGVFFSGGLGRSGADLAGLGTGDNVLRGFRARYVTAHANGLYGVYAFGARFGTIDHVYVSGHPDSGIYVGQCKPCDTLVTDSVAEANAIGYYGTNASGGVSVVRSVFRGNRVGLTPNSQRMEQLSPQAETVIAGNLVVDGGNRDAPAVPKGAFGLGIVIGGGTRNTVVRNRVQGNPAAGILVTDLETFGPENNRVEGNVVERNGLDLVYAPAVGTGPAGNCFVGNAFGSSSPERIEAALPCDGAVGAGGPFPRPAFTTVATGADYRSMPAPPAQPTMPDPATAPYAPVPAAAPVVDLAAVTVPAAP